MRHAIALLLFFAFSACGEDMGTADGSTDGGTTRRDAAMRDARSPLPDAPETEPLVRNDDFTEASGEVRNLDRGFFFWDDHDDDPHLVYIHPSLADYCGTETLPDGVIDDIRDRLESERGNGRRAIFRLIYADDGVLNECGRADAESMDIIEGHLEQLAPTLREYGDVIAYYEAGLFGMWGEWNSEYAPPDTSLWDDDANQMRLVRALLAAIPEERSVLLRRPRFRADPGYTADELSRIGFHNDCFLRNEDDAGTYDGDRSVEEWKDYIHEATASVPIGGETCGTSELTTCENAIAEMERLRFYYLHEGYHPGVISGWSACIDEIRERLGYRVVLRATEMPERLTPGGILRLRLELENVGFAPPPSSRRIRVVLRSGADEIVLTPAESTNADTRDWLPGAIEVELVSAVPADLSGGDWEIRLALLEDLSDAPEYAMMFANDGDVQDTERGENLIGTAIAP